MRFQSTSLLEQISAEADQSVVPRERAACATVAFATSDLSTAEAGISFTAAGEATDSSRLRSAEAMAVLSMWHASAAVGRRPKTRVPGRPLASVGKYKVFGVAPYLARSHSICAIFASNERRRKGASPDIARTGSHHARQVSARYRSPRSRGDHRYSRRRRRRQR